ncbi:MAG: hypothetical protein D6733_01560 [Methanobacteriota archaeon]|nr:MAG: hypothetical protein D6733_01560 [Euryarchaeota archaeon]
MEDVKALKNKIAHLETELKAMKKSLGVAAERKDPKAWERLYEVGREISRSWKERKPSWQIISEARR